MNTKSESNWRTDSSGTPWIQKSRPGLRDTMRSMPGRLAALPVSQWAALAVASEPVNCESLTNVRQPRLLREAHESDEGDASGVKNAFVTIVIAVLGLLMYWGTATIMPDSATLLSVEPLQYDPSILSKSGQPDNLATAPPEKSRAATGNSDGAP